MVFFFRLLRSAGSEPSEAEELFILILSRRSAGFAILRKKRQLNAL